MQLLELIKNNWGWTGAEPVCAVEVNDFGNVLFKTEKSEFWRICPEELSCQRIARDDDEFTAKWQDEVFLRDWYMTNLMDLAQKQLGDLLAGQCYCLKLPAALGGLYDVSNLGKIDHFELLRYTGEMAEIIRDKPDGSQFKISID